MGWFGYGIYDGDGTQTCHYNFIKWAKIEKDDNIIIDWLKYRGTHIPNDKLFLLKKNYKFILKHIKKPKFWNEDDAVEWQMLLSLFIDNNVKAPKIIYDTGIEATEFLMVEHADGFNYPGRRRAALKHFIKKAKKNQGKK